MPVLAPAALAVAIVLSALGAIILCLLTVLYGFTPAGEEPAGSAARRQLTTRIGHAVAAVCFTATAILLALVLARSPAPPAAVADARAPNLDTRLEEQATRLDRAESRLTDLEESLRREAAQAVTPPAAARAAEPAPRRQTAVTRPSPPPAVIRETPRLRREDPSPARVIPATPGSVARPATVSPRERFVPVDPAGAGRPGAPSAAAPPEPSRLAAPSAAAAPSPPPSRPAGRSAAAGAVESSPAASAREPAADGALAGPGEAGPRLPPAAAARRTPAETPDASRSSLRDKLRDDWKTIRRGIQEGEDDFWRVVDDTRRKIRRLVGW